MTDKVAIAFTRIIMLFFLGHIFYGQENYTDTLYPWFWNGTIENKNETQDCLIVIESAEFISRNTLAVRFSGLENCTATKLIAWLGNKENAHEYQIRNSTAIINIVETGWDTLTMEISGIVVVLNRKSVQKSYFDSFEAYGIPLVAIAIFLTIITIAVHLVHKALKKNKIRLFLPNTRQEHLKTIITATDAMEAIELLHKGFGYRSVFTGAEFRHYLEELLKARGIREGVSEFSSYLVLHELTLTKMIGEQSGFYFLPDCFSDPTTNLLIRIAKDRLMAKGKPVSMVEINNKPAINLKSHLVIGFKEHVSYCIEKNLNFVCICKDEADSIEMQKKYYQHVKCNGRIFVTIDSF